MTRQVALTIITKIKPGEVDALGALLDRIGGEAGGNLAIPFAKLPSVHFARFLILPEAKDLHGRTIQPSLVYATSIDAPIEEHLQGLVEVAGETLDRLYSHCEGYPPPSERTPQRCLAYLRRHQVNSHAFYVNTVGRTAEQVHREAKLWDAIEAFLDCEQAQHGWSGWSATGVRQAIQDFVNSQPTLNWARSPAVGLNPVERLQETIHFAAGSLGILVAALLFLPIAPIWSIVLRREEISDARQQDSLRLSNKDRGSLALREDRVVQNQFSAVGLIKPGWFRASTTQVLLWLLDFAVRHVFNDGNLAGVALLGLDGVDTIHFARWIVIDEGRRVLFMSNYDGSLESYMNDFINKVAWGLNAVFSNGVGYPKTRWLVLDGAKDEQAFKAFIRERQIATPIWYSAYPNLSAINLGNNAQIRAGLFRDLDRQQIREWLRRL